MTNKINYTLNNLQNSSMSNNIELNPADFISRANTTTNLTLNGTIESLFLVNDSVFAIIRKKIDSEFTASGDQIDHGDGWFNGPDRTPPEDVTVSELAILTNIDASNNKLERFINKDCKVTVKNGIATFAEVDYGLKTLTTFPTEVIKQARTALAHKTDDIFSDLGKDYFKRKGYTENEVTSLSGFKYIDTMINKLNTFKGEASWFKDTSQQDKNENILETNDIIQGLNKLGMKTNKCHIPSRLFSGK